MGGMLHGTRRALLAGRPNVWKPDPTDGTFTAGMAKRTAPGPFATAPIVQGSWAGTGTPDALSFARGTLLGNQTQYFYANFDPYQGDIVLWLRPEWAGNDGIEHNILYISSNYRVFKTAGNLLQLTAGGQSMTVDISAWTAGTTYNVTCAWDTKNTIDGTNYGRISINDSQTFGATTQPTAAAPDATIGIGSTTTPTLAGDAVIEAPTIYCRPLCDGTYGVDVGNGDELALIYAAGAGADPCLITGSWDVCFCLPTDSTAGALTTGTGEAWSHPHGSNIPDVWGAWDGGLPGTPYAVEFDGSATYIDCGSGATLDDIPSGAQMTVEGWYRLDEAPSSAHMLVSKGDGGITITGWSVYITNTSFIRGYANWATTDANANSPTITTDGKWHHFAVYIDDTAKTVQVALDGVWGTVSGAGAGAYVSDAALNLTIGRSAGAATYFYGDGGIAWVAIWSDDHHVAGTDFIPPRTAPTPGGNLVECWHLDEGTGATAAAQVTTPANDGTITSGTWSAIWEQEGTPVIPQSHTLDGTTTGIDCGSGATLDDIPSGAEITIDVWIRGKDLSIGCIIQKGSTGSQRGWVLFTGDGNNLIWRVYLATTDMQALYTPTPTLRDNVWHHIVGYYNDTTKYGRLGYDGRWVASNTGAGAYQADAADNLTIGNNAATWKLQGAIGRARVSDNDRYTAVGGPVGYVIEDRVNHPAADGNTIEQWNFVDGAGTTLTAIVTSPANDGTITPGTGEWLNTPDMTLDEPGARIYNNGYGIGSDGASDGITIVETVTAATDYVIRLVLSLGQSGRAWPEVYLYDNTNAAQIGATFSLPRCHDVHTGANNSATLINANGSFTQQLVGWECYNITDGSTGTITAVSGDKTTITVTLAGGTDNDFDTNDVYLIRPPSDGNYCDHPFATETIFVFRTPAGCVSADIKLRNAAGEGVMQIHQCEVLESMIDGGDMEAGAGNPWIPTGWTNAGLDVGDTEAEAVTVHSGAQSMEWNPGASSEYIYINISSTSGKFLGAGVWLTGDGGSRTLSYGTEATNDAVIQYDPATSFVDTAKDAAVWQLYNAVWRATNNTVTWIIYAQPAAGADRFSDDLYVIEMDDVSLTVTPASEANSAEGDGIRVDGDDTLTQVVPVGKIGANAGDVRFNWTPRHGDTESVLFGNTTPDIFRIYGDANNYVGAFFSAADNVRLFMNADGGGYTTADWATGGSFFTPGTTYEFRIRWTGASVRLYVDNVLRTTITAATGFVWPDPTTAYYGSNSASPPIQQIDAVYSAV